MVQMLSSNGELVNKYMTDTDAKRDVFPVIAQVDFQPDHRNATVEPCLKWNEMTFPDQSHINRVRDALHRNVPETAHPVMVGSGFSQ